MLKGPDLTMAPAEECVFAQEGLEGQGSPSEQSRETHFLCRKDQGR